MRMNRYNLKRPLANSTNIRNHNNILREDYEPPLKQRTVVPDDEDGSQDSSIHKIQVHIRVRPENEKESKAQRIVDVIDDQMLLFDPLTDDGYTYHGKKYKEIGKKANKDLTFNFDTVFDETTSNMQVYERVIKSFVPSLVDGYNCTVFAYGPTGSGKTYTMLGYNGDPGIIYYTAMEIFHLIESRPCDEEYEIGACYFEIYNEKVHDLLSSTSHPLKVVDNMGGGVNILGMTLRTMHSADDMIDTLQEGNSHRAQQATDVNKNSSRSHAVFQVFIKKKKCIKGKQIITQETKMCLVDLAGSERASLAYKENRSKSLQREGGNINKSLLALGNCINALAVKSRKGGAVYIPYRSSVLTRILSDSLGGNCRTAMIATISPSSLSYDDTHNTLTYAHRTKGINLVPKRRSMIVGIQPRHQTLAIEALTQQNTELAEKNILLEAELARLKRQPLHPISSSMSSLDVLNSYKNALETLFAERLELRRKLLNCESELRKIEMKYFFKKMDVDRLGSKEGNQDTESFATASLYTQKLHFQDRQKYLVDAVKENEQKIKDLERQIKQSVPADDYFVNAYFREKDCVAELQDKIVADKHFEDVSNQLIERVEDREDTNEQAMQLLRKFYHLLDQNFLAQARKDEYESLRKRIAGKKSVAWRDDGKRKNSLIHKQEIRSILRLPVYKSLPRSPIKKEEEGLETVWRLTPPSLSGEERRGTFTMNN